MKDIKIIAAYEFLRRGYSGTNLRNEVNRFNTYLIKRTEENNPINFPENYLRKVWQINADNNISPADGAQIADFLQSWECNKLDIICKFVRFEMGEDGLYMYLQQGTTKEEVDGIDAEVYRHNGELKFPGDESSNIFFRVIPPEAREAITPEIPTQSIGEYLAENPHSPLKNFYKR